MMSPSPLMPALRVPEGVELYEIASARRPTMRATWLVAVDGEPIGKLTLVSGTPDRVLVSAPGWGRRHHTPNQGLTDLLAHAGVLRD